MATREIPRNLDALDELFAFVESSVGDADLDEKTRFCLKLAAEELFLNMVRHNVGSSDHVTVSFDRVEDRIRFQLIDHDIEPFDPDDWPRFDAARPIEKGVQEGLGLHLVRSVVDEITYSYRNRDMRVTVVKLLEG